MLSCKRDLKDIWMLPIDYVDVEEARPVDPDRRSKGLKQGTVPPLDAWGFGQNDYDFYIRDRAICA